MVGGVKTSAPPPGGGLRVHRGPPSSPGLPQCEREIQRKNLQLRVSRPAGMEGGWWGGVAFKPPGLRNAALRFSGSASRQRTHISAVETPANGANDDRTQALLTEPEPGSLALSGGLRRRDSQ